MSAVSSYNRWIAKWETVQGMPVYDRTAFPEVALFESYAHELAEELSSFVDSCNKLPQFEELSPRQNAKQVTRPGWRLFYLKFYGVTIEESRMRLPLTYALTTQCRRLMSTTVSVLAPHTTIPTHLGPTKAYVRVHLLLTGDSDGKSTLTVSSTRYGLNPGRAIVFDDTLPHSSANDGDGIRIALLLDLFRPVRWPASVINRFVVVSVGLVHPDAVRMRAAIRRVARYINQSPS